MVTHFCDFVNPTYLSIYAIKSISEEGQHRVSFLVNFLPLDYITISCFLISLSIFQRKTSIIYACFYMVIYLNTILLKSTLKMPDKYLGALMHIIFKFSPCFVSFTLVYVF